MRVWHAAAILCTFAFHNSLPGQTTKTEKIEIKEIGGRSLESWINDIRSKDPGKRSTAIQNVQLFGERSIKAVKPIIDALKKHAPPTSPVDASVRVHGAMALGNILGTLKEADKKLVADAVSVLRRYLGDGQVIIQIRGAQALEDIGPRASAAIPDLLAAAKEPLSWEVRQAAVAALGAVAWDEKAGPPFVVLKGLFAALGDNAVQVRMAAIQSMTMLGQPDDNKVLLAEANALDPVAKKDPEASIRIWAQVALINLTGNVAKERLNPICDLAEDKESAVRVEAVTAIGTIGKDAAAAIPVLIKALGDPEPNVVARAAWGLGRMGSAALAAVPILQKIIADPKSTDALKRVAQEAVDYITGKKKDKK